MDKKLMVGLSILTTIILAFAIQGFESYFNEDDNKVIQLDFIIPEDVKTYLFNQFDAISEITDNNVGSMIVLDCNNYPMACTDEIERTIRLRLDTIGGECWWDSGLQRFVRIYIENGQAHIQTQNSGCNTL